jgi:hypothetical protein
VARRYFFPLFWQGLKEGSWAKLDTAVYALNVYNVLIGSIVAIILWVDMLLPGSATFRSLFEYSPDFFMVVAILSYIQFPLALIIEKASWKTYLYLVTFPVFMLSWWPITVYAFFTQNNKQWSHTEHTRVIRLEEVQSKQVS